MPMPIARSPLPLPQRSIFLFAIAIMAACCLSACGRGSGAKDSSDAVSDPNLPQASITTANIADLIKHDSGAVTFKGELFSGRAIERNANGNGELARENYYYQGYLQGPVRVFYDDGSKKSDTQYDKGVANGISFEWDSDGNMTQILYENGIETHRATGEGVHSSAAPSPSN